MIRVFMYGTLKRGQPNHYVLSEVGADKYKFVGKGYTSTKWPLVISSEHNIPYLLDKEGDGYNIKGEVYEIDNDLLAHIDQFECYPDIYGRRKVEIVMATLETDSQTDSTTASKDDSKADPKADSKADSKADPRADSKDDSKTDPKADLKADLETDSTATERPDQERTRMECWIYFLPEPSSTLLELEKMEDYDSYGAHGKPYRPIYVQDKGWVGDLEKPSS